MQRNADANLLVLFDPLEIDVHDRILERVPLHVLQDGRLRLIAHLQIQDGRIEALVVEHDQELLMVQSQCARVGVPTVKNRRYFSFVTQAAARTFALRLAELGDEFERGFHNLLQLHHEHGARASRPIARAPTNQFNVDTGPVTPASFNLRTANSPIPRH